MQIENLKRLTFFKEPIIWLLALIVLYFIYPVSSGDFSFCIFHLMGWENCWGCGIGKSMSCVMHGEIKESFNYHYLGIFTFPLLASRVAILTYKGLKLKT